MIKDEEVRKFFEFLVYKKAESKYTKDLEIYVNDAKNNMEYKRQFMEWERQMAYQYANGIKQGKIDAATEFLKEGVDPKIIAKCVKLPLEQVLELQQKQNKQ